MKFSESLKKNKDFRHVYDEGKSYANRILVMYAMTNGLEKNRLGISVSKKVGNSVIRHRLTRLIRESYRLNESHFSSGLDIVVIARVNGKNAGKTAWTPYSADISGLIKKGKNRIVCRLTTPAGQVYHAPGIPEHLQRQGWVNDCLKTTLQFSAPPLPEINDLPSFLLIPAEREGGEKC